MKLWQKLNFLYYFLWSLHEKKPPFYADLSNRNKENREKSEKIREMVSKFKIRPQKRGKNFSLFSRELFFKKLKISINYNSDKMIVESSYHFFNFLFQFSSFSLHISMPLNIKLYYIFNDLYYFITRELRLAQEMPT